MTKHVAVPYITPLPCHVYTGHEGQHAETEGILHMLGLIHKVPLPEPVYCRMVNVTRAFVHVPSHLSIYVGAAAKGRECE